MNEREGLLTRIADALERLAPSPRSETDWTTSPAYVWTGAGATRSINHIEAPTLKQMRGIDTQKQTVAENIARLAAGYAAHDMLLWGARGMGKSALLRASVAAAQETNRGRIALVQIAQEALSNLSGLFGALGAIDRRFIIFIDDLGFEAGDSIGPRLLRSWLEGGVEARPANIRLAVTSNRRAIVARHLSEQNDPINPRDAVDDRLALADRFGLSIGFHNCSQEDYLQIVAGYAEDYGLEWQLSDALEWSKRRGARSGRVAWQYIVELAGRAGKPI